MHRRILQPADLSLWKKSPAFRRLATFISDVAANQQSASECKSEFCLQILTLIDELCSLTKKVPAVAHARFGNPAFREWHSKAAEKITAFFQSDNQKNLAEYMADSLGNPTRIDYGTGHELCFAIFLLLLLQKHRLLKDWAEVNAVFNAYFSLIRDLIVAYKLEPAGSHGVWGLDDYQFLPFLLGAFQMQQQSSGVKPFEVLFHREMGSSSFTFLQAIAFVNKYKTGGAFSDHSPTLYSILTSCSEWNQIGAGLVKMHRAEVMEKFPVVQHLKFCEEFPFIE
jgi:serine/threonine-protein phosphatase 2A activator